MNGPDANAEEQFEVTSQLLSRVSRVLEHSAEHGESGVDVAELHELAAALESIVSGKDEALQEMGRVTPLKVRKTA